MGSVEGFCSIEFTGKSDCLDVITWLPANVAFDSGGRHLALLLLGEDFSGTLRAFTQKGRSGTEQSEGEAGRLDGLKREAYRDLESSFLIVPEIRNS